MEIIFTKNTDGQHSISYRRDDGSVTWMRASMYFVQHDLSHYAVETTLGYRTAFLGMINNGMGIHDFEDRQKRLSMRISDEAWYAESMANIFLMELSQGLLEDFNQTAAAAFAEMKLPIPPPALTLAEADRIRRRIRELILQWQQLPEKEALQLSF